MKKCSLQAMFNMPVNHSQGVSIRQAWGCIGMPGYHIRCLWRTTPVALDCSAAFLICLRLCDFLTVCGYNNTPLHISHLLPSRVLSEEKALLSGYVDSAEEYRRASILRSKLLRMGASRLLGSSHFCGS